MDLLHLKLEKTGNAKYRRRVTSPQMRALLGKSAVEWSLKTRDPLKIVEAWKEADARFEAMLAKAEGRETSQVEWESLVTLATLAANYTSRKEYHEYSRETRFGGPIRDCPR
jgi:hypothetical protein